MRSRFRPALAACSLVLSLLLLVAWPVSYWQAADIQRLGGRAELGVGIHRGVMGLGCWWARQRPLSGQWWAWSAYDPAPVDLAVKTGGLSLLGFGFADGGAPWVWTVYVPAWLPILLSLVPPALWWRRRRKTTARGFEVETRPAEDNVPNPPGGGGGKTVEPPPLTAVDSPATPAR